MLQIPSRIGLAVQIISQQISLRIAGKIRLRGLVSGASRLRSQHIENDEYVVVQFHGYLVVSRHSLKSQSPSLSYQSGTHQ